MLKLRSPFVDGMGICSEDGLPTRQMKIMIKDFCIRVESVYKYEITDAT